MLRIEKHVPFAQAAGVLRAAARRFVFAGPRRHRPEHVAAVLANAETPRQRRAVCAAGFLRGPTQRLVLRRNGLRTLPASFGNLAALEKLRIEEEKLCVANRKEQPAARAAEVLRARPEFAELVHTKAAV